jgi:diphthamide biosynthesis protein 2
MTQVTAPLPLSEHHEEGLISRTIAPRLETVLHNLLVSLDDVYEIDRTAELLRTGNFHTVALQFPDDLLHDAAQVSQTLVERNPDIKTYILADTTYGRCVYLSVVGADKSCCVDEIAAEHVNADVVVHYGRACLSPYMSLL